MHHKSPLIDYKIKISGEAGDGLLTTGDILMTAASKLGYNSSVFKSFPSNIRGGYSQAMVTISDQIIVSPIAQPNLLFLTSELSFDHDLPVFTNNEHLFVESTIAGNDQFYQKINLLKQSGLKLQEIHIKDTARKVASNNSIRSVVTLGYLCWLLQIPIQIINELISVRFKNKGNETVKQNLCALERGYLQAQSDIEPLSKTLIEIKLKDKNRIILEGNQAISIGALIAGANFFASYPITPATSIGEYLSKYLPQNNGFAYQAEDEIAAIGAAIGASFSGSKAFTATSGPGLSLMQEFIGYASMTELPIVLVDVQRAGPSTGMSTKHAQEDLLAATFGGHGEGQRIVLAPSGVEDCLATTVEAFNLSEHYQCPVILLSDASLSAIKQTVSCPDPLSISKVQRAIVRECEEGTPFMRYRQTKIPNQIPVPGISPVCYRVTGIEHDESCRPSVNAATRNIQMERRSNKLLYIEQEQPQLMDWDLEKETIYKADFTLIAWGLTASIARKSVSSMRCKGFKIAALYPKLLFPVIKNSIEKLLQFSERLFIPEANFSGQYSRIIRMHTDAKPHPITIYRDDPFTPEEIEVSIIKGLQS